MTKKQLNIIIDNTPAELKGTQPYIHTVFDTYSKAGTNWCYIVGYVEHKGLNILVATRFGQIM